MDYSLLHKQSFTSVPGSNHIGEYLKTSKVIDKLSSTAWQKKQYGRRP